MSATTEFNVLVITCGDARPAFKMVNTSVTTMNKQIEVEGCWRIILNFSLAEGFADLKEKCSQTDAYLILYNPSKPKTVAIYDQFIKDIIMTKRKAVRVVGLLPQTMSASIRRQSQRSRLRTSGWGNYHSTLINKTESEIQMEALYRDIGAELIRERNIATKKKPKYKTCTIL